METVASLFERLEEDEWRSGKGFSTEIATTQEQIFAASDKRSGACQEL